MKTHLTQLEELLLQTSGATEINRIAHGEGAFNQIKNLLDSINDSFNNWCNLSSQNGFELKIDCDRLSFKRLVGCFDLTLHLNGRNLCMRFTTIDHHAIGSQSPLQLYTYDLCSWDDMYADFKGQLHDHLRHYHKGFKSADVTDPLNEEDCLHAVIMGESVYLETAGFSSGMIGISVSSFSENNFRHANIYEAKQLAEHQRQKEGNTTPFMLFNDIGWKRDVKFFELECNYMLVYQVEEMETLSMNKLFIEINGHADVYSVTEYVELAVDDYIINAVHSEALDKTFKRGIASLQPQIIMNYLNRFRRDKEVLIALN